MEGYLEIIKLLLNKGADVSAQGGRLSNALQVALFRGHLKIVKLLQGRGAITSSSKRSVSGTPSNLTKKLRLMDAEPSDQTQ